MHAPSALQKVASYRMFGLWTIKIKILEHIIYLMDLMD